MRNPIWLFPAILIALASAAAASATDPLPPHPNVLFISIDDLRDWVGYFGPGLQVKTPNLDRLSKMGESFTRAYCAAPVCNPSRAATLSGLRPSTTGVYDNRNDWRTVVPPEMTLPTAFRRAGYFVCGSGKIYHEAYARLSEWDDYLDPAIEGGLPAVPAGQDTGVGGLRFAPLDCKDEDLNDWRIVTYGIEQLQKKHDRPFFLTVGVHKPHLPWNVPRKYFDLFPLDSIQLPPHIAADLADIPPAGVAMAKPEGDHAAILSSGRWKEAVQGYLAAIAYTDMNIGRLLDALEKSPDRANTIVCVWGDHGWHLGEKEHWRKFALWEETTRSPLIWIVPGMTKPGSICARTIDFMTIYPTLTDLCGIPTPKHVEGPSIRPLLADPAAAWDRPALTTYKFNNHSVRNADWRYTRYANGDEELYHDAVDENEWTNLATRPEFAVIKLELAKFMPTGNRPDIGGVKGQGAEDFGAGKSDKDNP